MKQIAILVLGIFLTVPPAGAQNPSLFDDAAPNLFLFRNVKARSVNDIVTILIVENSSASNAANTSTKKDGSFSGFFGLEARDSNLNIADALQANSNLNFLGQGSTSRSGQLHASLSARVIEVLPNGDMVIEGTKEVTINRERQNLAIRGVVRSRDVTPFNVVLSTAIANMQVTFDGKGIVSDANKPGFLYRILRVISPF
jgi:flagellar L-ring protein precursor FlgH